MLLTLTASLGKKLHGWIEVSSTSHKCVRNASVLCAIMVLKFACTMRPTKLPDMQFGLHCLAVKPVNLLSIFRGILPTVWGTFMAFILSCCCYRSFSLIICLSLQMVITFFAVPSRRLCMGSITWKRMALKYGRLFRKQYYNLHCFSICFLSFSVVACLCLADCCR